MKKAESIFIAVVLFLVTVVGFGATAQTPVYTPKDAKLYKTILHMDSVMFDAFNAQNIDALSKLFAINVEFYNDGGGVSDYATTIKNFKEMFLRNKNTGLRRELVPGTLEVYPVPGFGAIEIGTHRFIHTENGKQEVGIMKFIHTWQLKAEEWKVTRVISIGH